MSKHELSKLQEAELDIFKEFIRICQENHLRYFICGGSFWGQSGIRALFLGMMISMLQCLDPILKYSCKLLLDYFQKICI